MKKTVGIFFILFLTLISSGCSSITKAEQPAVFDSVALNKSNSVGQSFSARFDGLNGIEIYLDTPNNSQGEILLTLRENPQSENISQVTIPIEDISTTGFYHFPFPVQGDSNQQSYYILLRIKGESSLNIGAAPGNTYLNGALYQDGQPDDQHQMAFQLSYDNSRLLLGLVQELLLWGWYLLVAVFLFVLPGWALLNILWSPYKQHITDDSNIFSRSLINPITKLAIASGISIAIYPISFLWTNLVGLHLGIWYAWIPPIVGCVFLLWQFAHQRKLRTFALKLPTYQIADVVLSVVILLIILTRFWAIRSLPLPLWGDSYHHTMITQLMIDNKGLFNSWHPYAESITFTYHFGFHSISTVFHWITNIPAAQTTMIIGQIINIMAVLTLYPLAVLLFNNKWSGVIALLISGLISSMPMFYVNWGRYTQLTGQVFLLVAVWITWIIFMTEKRSWRLLIPTWIIIASLSMTHYRVIFFYLMFFAAYLILHIRKHTYRKILTRISWIGIGAGILYLPWFINVFGGRILSLFSRLATKPPTVGSGSGINAISYSVGDLTTYLPIGIWILVIPILAICIWQRKLMVVTISLWWFFIFLLANPHWFHLPGAGIIDNFAVFIAAYIPAGLILASIPILYSLKPNLDHNKIIWAKIALSATLIGLGFWGAWQRHSEVDPLTFALAAKPDIRAATWIKDNITPEARFLVNSFFAYSDSVIVGSDGGWWLPLIADRQTTLPPITYAFEKEPFPDYSTWIQIPTRMIETYGITHPTTIDTFKEFGVTHIYIGQQQGSVNYSGPLRLNPAELQNNLNFEPIYHQDRVWIFEFEP
jgi:hypothetical protein